MTQYNESTVEFPYRRSLGPVIGRYVAGLADHRILGVRSGDRTLVPPLEYDPDTGIETGELVDVGPAGTVMSWTWVPSPSPKHPLDRPFAFALIRLDGADTDMVHAVDVSDIGAMSTGMRVLPTFRDEPKGRVDDLACFVPAVTATASEPKSAGDPHDLEPVMITESWSSLTYKDIVAPAGVRYASALMSGKIIGQQCPVCQRTYIPPRDFCTIDAIELDESHDKALPDHGVITNYTIVTPVQYPGQLETEPFARVGVLLDDVNAMVSLQPVVDIPNDQVRPGLRVEAVWLPEAERDLAEMNSKGWGSVSGAIRGWKASGEPDEPAERHIGRVF